MNNIKYGPIDDFADPENVAMNKGKNIAWPTFANTDAVHAMNNL